MLTAEYLRSRVSYDPETGVFTWLAKPNTTDNNKAWNVRRQGTRAGFVETTKGYRSIELDGRNHREHRLAWLYVHGEWPPEMVDHINGDRTDNRISNLRLANLFQNAWNRRKPAASANPLLGATFHKATGKWLAQIAHLGRAKHLGLFDSPEEAHEAYMSAARDLRGEFAPKLSSQEDARK